MAPENGIIDLSILRKITADDKEKMNYYIGLYLKTAPDFIKGIEDAIFRMNRDELYSKAHSLKPMTSYVGIVGLSDCLGEIEKAAKEKGERNILEKLVKKAIEFNKRGTAELKTYIESSKVI